MQQGTSLRQTKIQMDDNLRRQDGNKQMSDSEVIEHQATQQLLS